MLNNRPYVLILEDSQDRADRFLKATSLIDCRPKVVVLPDVASFLKHYEKVEGEIDLISLDHDLYSDVIDDPGDGVQVAKYLACRDIKCPVLIHTSNSDRGRMMQGDLDLGGWEAMRVPAIGESWIEDDWIVVVERKLEAKRNYES